MCRIESLTLAPLPNAGTSPRSAARRSRGQGTDRPDASDAVTAALDDLLYLFVFAMSSVEERMHAAIYYYVLMTPDAFVSIGVFTCARGSLSLCV